VNKFETKRLWLKIGFVLAAILLPMVLPFLAPSLGVREGGKIPLSSMQVLYAVLSVELAVAVYVWGVGNWSRFEPPPLLSASSVPQMGGPAQPPGPGPASPLPVNVAPPTQPPGVPPPPQGGH
jgi:hypothetical protein